MMAVDTSAFIAYLQGNEGDDRDTDFRHFEKHCGLKIA